MLVGTLVLAALGGGGKTSASAAATPAAAAVATQVAGADTSELADKVAGFINQLRGDASGVTADFVRSMRGEKTVERRVPTAAAQAKEAASLPDPRPVVQHVHLKRPPPAPPKTEAELAEVMAQRAMYERIKAMHDVEDLAAD